MQGGKGTVFAAFSKAGRVALAATTAARRGERRTGQLRRRYPQSRRLGRSIVRAGARSSRIFGVRGGKVRFVAVASPRTIARRALLRTYLRRTIGM